MTFGSELRRLRRMRGMSQLALSHEVGTGQRHLSFLERGKAKPGRPLVLRLAEHLGLSPAERDDLLLAAGLVPEVVRLAPQALLEAVVRGYLPYPAVIIDPWGGVVAANAAVALITEHTPLPDHRGVTTSLRLRSSRGDLNLTIVTTALNGCLLKTFLPADSPTANLLTSSLSAAGRVGGRV